LAWNYSFSSVLVSPHQQNSNLGSLALNGDVHQADMPSFVVTRILNKACDSD
jgi:hypothetical protein